MSKKGVLAAVALTCTAIVGCGGASGASAREKRFVAQANAICAQELAALNRTPEPASPTQAIGYLPKAIAIIRRQSARLAALSVPASKRAELDAALSGGQQLGAVLEGFLRKLHSGAVDLSTFAQVQSQSVALREQINAQFRKAGLTRCVTGT
jgi:hypothetical protein